MSALLRKTLRETGERSEKGLRWLERNMHPYFFITMDDEREAIVNLAAGLHRLQKCGRIILDEDGGRLVLAGLTVPGSFYEALRSFGGRNITYAELNHSLKDVPGAGRRLEVLRFESGPARHPGSGRKSSPLPEKKAFEVKAALMGLYPAYDSRQFETDLAAVVNSNARYAGISPPDRIARVLWLYQGARHQDGLFFEIEEEEDSYSTPETRVLFAVRNPPGDIFLVQLLEIFRRLRLGVHRAYSLTIHDGESPCFLGTFYVKSGARRYLEKDSKAYGVLKGELYNTQVLSTTSRPYRSFVLKGVATGEEASLVNAFIGFCYTSLAHNQPDRYHLAEVIAAFTINPDMALRLCRLFAGRFDPEGDRGGEKWQRTSKKVEADIEKYRTGHRHLDEVRRTIYRTALLFVRSTVKTNFFVQEKHALAFRLDPSYLDALGEDLVGDLPPDRPFRVTFFSGRHGMGYHIGFADIARGGWRTVVSRDEDDYNENAETLFREVYVLAHTQHLKNKDIYEGGSKMVVLLDCSDEHDEARSRERLHKIQYGFFNAFLDIFAGEEGRPCHHRVVDYYGEEEAIELGPDENMHDGMIELIARQSVRRNYLLGSGVISSKKSGINHRVYGVTAIGVVTFAAAALRELGTDPHREGYSLKMTGGPSGDVAGNTLNFLLHRSPKMQVKLIVDGSGVLYDPLGADHRELKRLIPSSEIDGFRPGKLHSGGFLLSRRQRRRDGTKTLFLKFEKGAGRPRKRWVTTDEMHHLFEEPLYSVETDLFIPAGGRPETVHDETWKRFFGPEGRPSCRVIVEGANSFLTPGARDGLQEGGIMIIRDASANKCGVISSSYEIIANLLMNDGEFLDFKDDYVADVLAILEKRAADEGEHIFRRRRESGGKTSWTDISEALSREINEHYRRLFDFLRSQPGLLRRPSFHRVLRTHLPDLISRTPKLLRRIPRLPVKYRCAMVASEIATTIVYRGGWTEEYGDRLTEYVRSAFPR